MRFSRSQVVFVDDDPNMLEAEIDLLAPYFDVVGIAANDVALISLLNSSRPRDHAE